MKPQPTEFSTRLRETMRAKGIMQIEMAQRCGVTQSAISHLCCGRNNIADVNLLFTMAAVLEVDAYWLATGEESGGKHVEEVDGLRIALKAAKDKAAKTAAELADAKLLIEELKSVRGESTRKYKLNKEWDGR